MRTSLRRYLIHIIVIASFVLSASYALYHRIAPVVDAQAYDQVAVNLLDGYGFREDRRKSFEFDTAIIRAGPGYEFFLAGIYAIFSHRYEAVWIIQALLHAASALLLFLICRRLFAGNGDASGFVAAALFGLHPDLIEISAMLMTETLYLFLVILTVYIFVRLMEQPKAWGTAGMLGLATGVTILTRPPVVLFAPIILWFLLRRRQYRSVLFFAGLLLLTMLPWIVRNYIRYDQFILTTMIGSYNLWIGNTLTSDGGQISGGFNPVTAYTSKRGFSDLPYAASQEFWFFVIAHPAVFIKLCLLRFVRFFSLIRPMGFWFYQHGLSQFMFVAASGLAIAVLFISGFSGIIQALRERKEVYYYIIILALTAPLPLLLTVVQSRYRFQVYPFLAIFGGYALVSIMKRWPAAKKNMLWAGAYFGVITAVDAAAFWPAVVERVRLLFS